MKNTSFYISLFVLLTFLLFPIKQTQAKIQPNFKIEKRKKDKIQKRIAKKILKKQYISLATILFWLYIATALYLVIHGIIAKISVMILWGIGMIVGPIILAFLIFVIFRPVMDPSPVLEPVKK